MRGFTLEIIEKGKNEIAGKGKGRRAGTIGDGG